MKKEQMLKDTQAKNTKKPVISMQVDSIKTDIEKYKKQLKELKGEIYANSALKLVKVLKKSNDKIRVSKVLTSELNQLIGQIIDISRFFLLQKNEDEAQKFDKEIDLLLSNDE